MRVEMKMETREGGNEISNSTVRTSGCCCWTRVGLLLLFHSALAARQMQSSTVNDRQWNLASRATTIGFIPRDQTQVWGGGREQNERKRGKL